MEINRSCFRSADPTDIPVRSSVLTSPLALVTRLDIRSSIFWPVNSRSVLKVCLMRLIQHDRTRYTARTSIPLSGPPPPPSPSSPVSKLRNYHCLRFPSDLFDPSVAVIHFANEPLIGNCVELHPRRAKQDPIPVLLHHALLDGASALAWNERRRSDAHERYSSTWRLSLRFSKSTRHEKTWSLKLETFEMRLWKARCYL